MMQSVRRFPRITTRIALTGPRLIHSTSILRGSVEKCPPPDRDTGCTYCMPDMDKFPKPTKQVPPVPFHAKHLVISTGTSDWPSRIHTDETSMAAVLEPLKRGVLSTKDPVLITNSDLPVHEGVDPTQAGSAFLYPDGLYFPSIPYEKMEQFAEAYLGDRVGDEILPDIPVLEHKSPIVLICGHGARDERCGIIAPMLAKEFKAALTQHDLLYDPETNPEGVRVALCSHIGGHAFAGNVIYHCGDQGADPVWYSLVFPHHVQGIVKTTIVDGNIVQELARRR
uniref:Altered inheritance of mitochondria protein 32 n=1 Tax=Blastobotrys adeninivorans TaxID=409370 RepID=A0A060TBS6_BLAAD